jgi:CheY-like chemotaxis protein
MHVLLADDEFDTREILRIAFKLRGHQLTVVSNGAEAVNAAAKEPFDAIVLDIEMPIMDGYKALEHIRHLPTGPETPIVMFSAYLKVLKPNLQYTLGPDLMLEQPMLPHKLIDELEALLAKRQSQTPST